MRFRTVIGRSLLVALLGVGCLFAVARPAVADSAPAEPDWDAKIIAYGWLASVHADVDAGPVDTSLDIGIDKILQHLTWVGMAGFEVRYQQLLFQMDGLGMQLQDGQTSGTRTATFDPFGGPLGGGAATVGPVHVSDRLTVVMGEAALGYRVYDVPIANLFSSVPSDDARRFRIDLLGGARYWYFRNTARLSIPPATLTVGGMPVTGDRVARFVDRRIGNSRIPGSLLIRGSNDVFTSTNSWIDSIIGARVGIDVWKTVSLALRTDIGGFGFGDSSSFTWQVMPSVEWRFADHWSFDAAYRAIGVDKGPVSDAILYGFVLGVGYRF